MPYECEVRHAMPNGEIRLLTLYEMPLSPAHRRWLVNVSDRQTGRTIYEHWCSSRLKAEAFIHGYTTRSSILSGVSLEEEFFRRDSCQPVP